ncbi:RNA-binding protein [Candidatus Woesearchaeota archaeon]|nr:RNA-binding protein [Candidatus Woesearchaeota archaeon]
MGKLLVKDKEIVVPGDVIAEGMDFLPSFGTYRTGEKIIANRTSLLSIDGKVIKTIPLAGRYLPKRNDVIIGRVFDILMSGWRMDINSAYSAVLMLQEASFKYIQKGADLTKFFAIDDYVVVKITNVTSQRLVDVTVKGPGLRRLEAGRIVKVSTHKVPRIIGKQGSMVSTIKDATGCRITVGQNGVVWVQGEPEQEVLAVNAIKKIDENSHHSGLTDEIKKFLDSNKVKTKGDKK